MTKSQPDGLPDDLPDRRELEAIWLDIADGKRDSEQLKRLNAALRSDAGLREHFSQMLIDETILEKELEVSSVESALNGPPLTTATHEPSGRKGDFSRQSTATIRNSPWMWAMAACVAALLVTACMLLLPRSNTDPGRDMIVLEGDPAAADGPDKSTEPEDLPAHLATVTRSDQAKWSPPMAPHAKLAVGKYRLDSGRARLMMFNGIELVVDSQKSATEFELASARRVLLTSGTLIAQVHDQEIGFMVETPTTRLIDVGTEFAVTVSPEGGSQVSVLDGAVTVKPLEGRPAWNYSLFASEKATRFSSPADSKGVAVDGDQKRLRETQRSVREGSDHLTPLRAFEYFDGAGLLDSHDPPDANPPINGWLGPWRYGSFDGRPAKLITKPGPLRGAPAWLPDVSSRYLVQPSSSGHLRRLVRPLPLNQDATYFVSLLIQKFNVVEDDSPTKGGVGLSLFATDKWKKDAGVGFTLDGTDRFVVWTEKDRFNGGEYGKANTTYFVVLKISASKDKADNLFLKVYSQNDAIDFIEPERWDVVGKPADQNLQLDLISTWTGPSCFALIDQIRVGETWERVAPVR